MTMTMTDILVAAGVEAAAVVVVAALVVVEVPAVPNSQPIGPSVGVRSRSLILLLHDRPFSTLIPYFSIPALVLDLRHVIKHLCHACTFSVHCTNMGRRPCTRGLVPEAQADVCVEHESFKRHKHDVSFVIE